MGLQLPPNLPICARTAHKGKSISIQPWLTQKNKNTLDSKAARGDLQDEGKEISFPPNNKPSGKGFSLCGSF